MNKHYKVTVTLALFLIALMPVAASAATAAPKPKVVFLGDQITYNWTQAFAANPNWINKGIQVIGYSGFVQTATLDAAVARFQSDVVSQHPAIVHIMFGMEDQDTTSAASLEYFPPGVLTDVQKIVQEAKAANIQVVFGLEYDEFTQTAEIITSYAAQNNIPVINYGAVLGGTIYPAFTVGSPYEANQLVTAPLQYIDPGYSLNSLPTAAGYAIMTQMAEAVINTVGLKLTGGYLQNYTTEYEGDQNDYQANVNSAGPYHNVQFTPYGQFTGGLVFPMVNTPYVANNTGSAQSGVAGMAPNGTWASSNPLVMSVNQQGYAEALTAGKTNITYVSPTGVRFSEWTMTVVDMP